MKNQTKYVLICMACSSGIAFIYALSLPSKIITTPEEVAYAQVKRLVADINRNHPPHIMDQLRSGQVYLTADLKQELGSIETDPWGSECLARIAAGRLSVRSAGPDRTMGTPDDILFVSPLETFTMTPESSD